MLSVAEVQALRADGRRRLATLPVPLVAFGLVNLGGAVTCALVGRFHVAPYGVVAFTLAVLVSARAITRRARADGVQVSLRPVALTAAALLLGGMLMSRAGVALGLDVVSTVGPFLAQAVGLYLLARWTDSSALIAACLCMVAGSALIGSLTSGDLAVTLQFALYGILLLAAARQI